MSLQLETESTHVSNCQLLLYSQLADFELHSELLLNGVALNSDIPDDVHGFVVDVFEASLSKLSL